MALFENYLIFCAAIFVVSVFGTAYLYARPRP